MVNVNSIPRHHYRIQVYVHADTISTLGISGAQFPDSPPVCGPFAPVLKRPWKWWAGLDSNQGPRSYQDRALAA